MDETNNLRLPYIMPSQAQKFLTHNDALRDLDSIVQLAVIDRDLATPPGTPAAGNRYLVAASPTGAWAGNAGNIAAYQDGIWLFYAPQNGWRLWIEDEALLVAWTGSAWVVVGGQNINPAPMIGVLATADTTNRLSVKSDAVLFANDDVTPGTGDIRAVLSKSASAKTASFVFQDVYSGRAEFGLTGDDHFHLKVSPDGSSWTEALYVNNSTARVGIGTNAPSARLAVSSSASAPPAGLTGTLIHIVGADSTVARVQVNAFAQQPFITFARADGSAAAPSAVQAADQLGGFGWTAYGATAYSPASKASLAAVAAENWSDTAQGTYFTFSTTPIGSATLAERLRVDSTGNVGIGTTTPADRLHALQDDAGNAAVSEILRLTHTTSGTPAIGIGAGIEFEVETATAENREIGMKLDTVATNITGAAENFDFVVSLMAAGAAASEAFRVKAGGKMSLASGAFTANGSVATAMSSLGPTGAHATVQKWLAIDDAGTTRYVPCF